MSRISFAVYNPSNQLISKNVRPLQWRFNDTLSQMGGGSLKLSTLDPAFQESLINEGNFVKFAVDGTEQVGFEVTDLPRRTITDRNPEVDIGGSGLLGVLSRAIVYAERGVDIRAPQDRALNWISKDFLPWGDQNWSTPSTYGTQAAPHNAGWATFPLGWPALAASAEWMWRRPGSIGYIHPPGDAYFRKQFTIPDPLDIGLFGTADDELEIYLNNELIISSKGLMQWKKTFFEKFRIGAGTHQIAIRGRNLERPSGDSGAGVLFALGPVNSSGDLTSLLVKSEGAGWESAGYLDYPPGMTPGRSIGVLLAEAQARGGLNMVTTSFTPELTSPLPEPIGPATWGGETITWGGEDAIWGASEVPWKDNEDRRVGVGRTLLDTLMSISCRTVEVFMRPNFILDLWGHDEKQRNLSGGPAAVILRPGRDILKMDIEPPANMVNVFLADTPHGFIEEKNDLSITSKGYRVESFLSQGEADTPNSARLALQRTLEERDGSLVWATVKLRDNADVLPFVKYMTGDWISAPYLGTYAPWRVMSISGQSRRDSIYRPDWTLELARETS